MADGNDQEEFPEKCQSVQSLRAKFESGINAREKRQPDSRSTPKAYVIPQQKQERKETIPKQLPESTQKQGFSYLGVAKNEVRIVLIGKTGVGKSATGNTILGGEKFESRSSSNSITKKCHNDSEIRFGKRVLLVDTPGLFDNKLSNEVTAEEIGKCIAISAPGPHAFLIVVQIGRFTTEEKQTVEEFAKRFGEGFFKYAVVLFTRKEDIEREGLTLEKYIQKDTDDTLKEILNKCGNRCIAFNNFADQRSKDGYVKGLLDIIEQILNDNNSSFYSNEMYEAAEKVTQERINRALKEEKEKYDKEKEITIARHLSEIEKMREEKGLTEKEARKREEEMKKKQEEEKKEQDRKHEEDIRKREEEKRNEARMEYQNRGFLGHTQDAICSIGSAIAAPFKLLLGW